MYNSTKYHIWVMHSTMSNAHSEYLHVHTMYKNNSTVAVHTEHAAVQSYTHKRAKYSTNVQNMYAQSTIEKTTYPQLHWLWKYSPYVLLSKDNTKHVTKIHSFHNATVTAKVNYYAIIYYLVFHFLVFVSSRLGQIPRVTLCSVKCTEKTSE